MAVAGDGGSRACFQVLEDKKIDLRVDSSLRIPTITLQ